MSPVKWSGGEHNDFSAQVMKGISIKRGVVLNSQTLHTVIFILHSLISRARWSQVGWCSCGSKARTKFPKANSYCKRLWKESCKRKQLWEWQQNSGWTKRQKQRTASSGQIVFGKEGEVHGWQAKFLSVFFLSQSLCLMIFLQCPSLLWLFLDSLWLQTV